MISFVPCVSRCSGEELSEACGRLRGSRGGRVGALTSPPEPADLTSPAVYRVAAYGTGLYYMNKILSYMIHLKKRCIV